MSASSGGAVPRPEPPLGHERGEGSSNASSSAAPPPLILLWPGDKLWLLLKEGTHTLLDRILLKDSAHTRGIYGRLSRLEKRSAVLKYASALLQRELLVRNVIVDTISACVFDACEAEGRLEAPATGDNASALTKKKRLPFMQKVIGDALAETFAESLVAVSAAAAAVAAASAAGELPPGNAAAAGEPLPGTGTLTAAAAADVELAEMVALLQKQKAPCAVISDSLRRLREAWLGVPVSGYLTAVAEARVLPAVVYCESVAAIFGVDYFLPPLPAFASEDERHLADSIEIDQQEAGKETVFAANLKKALKAVRQSRIKAAQTAAEDDQIAPLAAPLAAFLAASAPGTAAATTAPITAGAGSGAPSRGPPFEPHSLDKLEAFLRSKGVRVPSPPGDPPMPPDVAAAAASLPSPISHAVTRARESAPGALPSSAPALPPVAVHGPLGGWWCSLRWAQRHSVRGVPTGALLAYICSQPAGWEALWSSRADVCAARRADAAALSAEEVCDMVDHSPLWLSLRGLVGSHLAADQFWPITGIDGLLTVAPTEAQVPGLPTLPPPISLRITRGDRSRFVTVADPAKLDAATLAATFIKRVRVLQGGVRAELVELGALQGVADAVLAANAATEALDATLHRDGLGGSGERDRDGGGGGGGGGGGSGSGAGAGSEVGSAAGSSPAAGGSGASSPSPPPSPSPPSPPPPSRPPSRLSSKPWNST